MMYSNNTHASLLFFMLSFSCFAQLPTIEWAKTYGGKQWDIGQSIFVTNDNNYIICGGTSSQDNGDSLPRPTKLDALVMKVDADGKLIWKKTYGGNADDFGGEIIQTQDGGFIFCGNTASTDSIFKSNKGNYDAWVVKLDSLGNLQWQKNYGGSSLDEARSIVSDMNGNFLFVLNSTSNDGDFNVRLGNSDSWIVKINGQGDIIWKKRIGGLGYENLYDLVKLDSKYFIAVGETGSKDSIVFAKGSQSADLVVKIDTAGTIAWLKSYGSPYEFQSFTSSGNSVIVSKDSHIIVFGFANTSGQPTIVHNSLDFCIAKIDTNGNRLWAKLYGGSGLDVGNSILQLPTGEFFATGNINSNNGDLNNSCYNKMSEDIWAIKFDSIGQIIWDMCMGGSFGDYPRGAALTKDGAVLITGNTKSNDGIFSSNNGSFDLPLIKIRLSPITKLSEQSPPLNVNYYPNPAGTFLNIDNNNNEPIILSIHNVLGQSLFSKKYETGSFQIDCSTFENGLYILTFSQNNNNITSRKLIIKK